MILSTGVSSLVSGSFISGIVSVCYGICESNMS